MVGVNCRRFSSSTSSISQLSSPRKLDNIFIQNVLEASPRFSVHNNPIGIIPSEKKLSDPAAFRWDAEKVVVFSSTKNAHHNGNGTPKSSAELRKEIAMLEFEILQLERHLLSLYRTAFEEHLPTLPNWTEANLYYETQSPSNKLCKKVGSREGGFAGGDQSASLTDDSAIPDASLSADLKASSTTNTTSSASGHRSLADLLGASQMIEDFISPNKLSEEILKCIASIYCKLSNSTRTASCFLASPHSSASSSSMFSSKNPWDSWSPHFSDDNSTCFEEQKKESLPRAAAIEVLKLCLDDDKNFNHTISMLQNFRSLVQSLDKVDPRKSKREEKLAFWINIHNALVMHAYLAYGGHNRVRSTSILKATYNVGGHCVDPYVIQSSILGIRPHYTTPFLQNLFSPGRKTDGCGTKHVYALEYPEPLVHFALCSGAYTDPQVRLFTADTIFRDLRQAREEFISANAFIDKGDKILLPKIIHHYAKDTSLDMAGLVEVVTGCVSEPRRKDVKRCAKGRREKCIRWLPEDLKFRYVMHGELARSSGKI